jgi:hypothetical protein
LFKCQYIMCPEICPFILDFLIYQNTNFPKYFLVVLLISIVSIVMFPFSVLVLLIMAVSFSFALFGYGLVNLIYLFKGLCVYVNLSVFISLMSALILILFFLLMCLSSYFNNTFIWIIRLFLRSLWFYNIGSHSYKPCS